MYFNLLVEGYVDEAVALKLLQTYGHEPGVCYGRKGWTYIEQKIMAFDRTCGVQGLFTLIDFMDTGKDCPAAVVRDWLPQRSRLHVFRVVVREIESWILADRQAIARFLSVPVIKVPLDAESLADPKQAIINLARTSRSKAIREALVPRPGYTAGEGPLYSSEVLRFVREIWNPETARQHSASLNRCIDRLIEVH
jgi:hypothetical protein